MKNNFFDYKSKADVIEELKNKKLRFNIPKTFSFTVEAWMNKKILILKKIKKIFKIKGQIAIRSSSRSEDTKNSSQAGKFSSFLNIPVNDSKKIISTINLVIKSYKKGKKKKSIKFLFKK